MSCPAGFDASKFDSNYVSIEAGRIAQIVESSPPLAGKVSFELQSEVILVRNPANRPPLRWSANGQCADGAIILVRDEATELHVIELKGRVGPGEWPSICRQFAGMIENVIAIASVSNFDRPTEIVCHLAFERDLFRPATAVDPVLFKVPTGGGAPLKAASDWRDGIVTLPDRVAKLKKIVRDRRTHDGVGNLDAVDDDLEAG